MQNNALKGISRNAQVRERIENDPNSTSQNFLRGRKKPRHSDDSRNEQPVIFLFPSPQSFPTKPNSPLRLWHSSSILLQPFPWPQMRALRAGGGKRTPSFQSHQEGVGAGCISGAGIPKWEEARDAVRSSLGFLCS